MMFMNNIPVVKLGIVAVSRDCFPTELSESRRKAVVTACREKGIALYECQTIVETENRLQKQYHSSKQRNAMHLLFI